MVDIVMHILAEVTTSEMAAVLFKMKVSVNVFAKCLCLSTLFLSLLFSLRQGQIKKKQMCRSYDL